MELLNKGKEKGELILNALHADAEVFKGGDGIDLDLGITIIEQEQD